jgi:hypothetical protein
VKMKEPHARGRERGRMVGDRYSYGRRRAKPGF